MEGSPPLTRIVFLLQAHGGAPRATSPQLGVGGICGTGRRTTNTGASARPGPVQSPHPVPCKASPVSLDNQGNRRTSPTTSTPPKREPTHWTHTHHRGGDPRRTPGLRETPPLGLRHLSNDLERSRGTTEGPTKLPHAPAPWGRSAAAAQPSPPWGELLAEHTPGRRRESICRVRRPTAPTDATQGRDRRPKVRARGHNPTPTFLRLPGGKSQARGPRGQTKKSRYVHWERLSLVWHRLGPA